MERQTRASDRVAGHTGMPLGVTLAVVVLILSAGAAMVAWQMAKTAADGVLRSVDELGIASARMLAAPEADWWDLQHGTADGAKELLLARVKEQEGALRDIKDEDARNAKGTILREFRTRLEDLLAADAPEDAAQVTRNKDRLKAMAGDPILAVDVYNAQRQPRGVGTRMPAGAATTKIGDTEVFAFTHESNGQQVRARLFLHPIKGREVGSSGKFSAAGWAGVAVSAESAYTAMDEARARALQVLAVVGGAGLLAAFVVLFPLLSLRQVLRDAEEFSRGNFDHRPSSAGTGEIGAVARAVARTALAARDRENDALAKAVAAVPPPTDHRAEVEPALKPGPVLRIPGWEAEGTSRPCFEIAGDFFDYCPVKGGGFAVILVETSLRGLPAAFAASEMRALFRGAAPAFEAPGALLGFLGAEAGPRLPAGHSVTATVAYVEPTSGRTLLARAGGGNAPVLWRAADRALEEIEVTGAALAREGGPGTGGNDPVDVAVELAARDRLSFFSDGLRRARNSRKEKFGEERLGGLILKFGPMNSTAFVNMVLNDVDLFHEGAQQKDDLTVLTVRRLK
jgi:serine phosphatase RsbU (regulator of sigma subunit)